jgi:hypothetical protein
MTVSGEHVVNASIYINDITVLIEQMNLLIDDYRITAQSPIYVLGDSDGYTYKVDETTQNDNGTAIIKNFTTKDFALDGYHSNSRLLWVDVVWSGTNLRLMVSPDKGLTWKEYSSDNGTLGQSADERDRFHGRSNGDTIRFKFETTGSNSWIHVVRYIMGWISGGVTR